MANFRIGQRVKIAIKVQYCDPRFKCLQGAETTVTSEHFERYGIRGYRTAASDALLHCIGVPEQYLIPLTDPRAEEFIGDMERFAKAAQTTVKA